MGFLLMVMVMVMVMGWLMEFQLSTSADDPEVVVAQEVTDVE